MARRAQPAPSNLLDRAIDYVAPAWAARRQRARMMAGVIGGYNAARSGRRIFGRSTALSGNAALLPDLPTLREHSRAVDRNTPIARGSLNTTMINVVGTGLTPRAQIDRDFLGLSEDAAARWEADANRLWRLWAHTVECDAERTQTFPEMQATSFYSALLNGDHFLLPRFFARPGGAFEFKLRQVEADRCENPNRQGDTLTLAGGVEVDANGAPLRYHFANRHPGDRLAQATDWAAVDAFDAAGRPLVYHLLDRRRAGTTRGEPYLAPVLEALKQLADYTEAELMAAVVNSCFAVALKSETGDALGLNKSEDATADRHEIAINEPGQIIDLMPNEELESFTPGRPSTSFDPFMMAIVRQMGAALDTPYELLIKHFTASYSASRAAIEMAWQFFRYRRQWLATRMCQPAWEEVIAESVAKGELRAPGFFDDPAIRAAYTGTVWLGPARISLDPKREAEADKVHLVDLGTRSRADITTERFGQDYQRVHAQLATEERMRRADGLAGARPRASASAAPDDPLPNSDREDSDITEGEAIR